MKFTPESLIEIYLNGSFTEEAQAEFDALMRSDASFAERVTHSVADRIGPLPEGLVDQVAGRLDSKMDGIWRANKPSPWSGLLRAGVKAALLLAAAGGLYEGIEHFGAGNLSVSGSGISSPAQNPVAAVDSVNLSKKTGESSLAKNKSKNPGALAAQRGRTLSLSFKERTASSLSDAPETFGGSPAQPQQANPSLNVNRGDGAEPGAGSTAKRAQVPGAGGSLSEEGDALRVSIEMEKTGKVIVTILDSNGLLVRSLYQGVWNQGLHLLDWDGKDEAGNQVQPGNYTVAVNAAGKTMSGTLTIQTDH